MWANSKTTKGTGRSVGWSHFPFLPHTALRAGFCALPFCWCMQYAAAACAGSNVAAVVGRGNTICALWTRLCVFFFLWIVPFLHAHPCVLAVPDVFLLCTRAHSLPVPVSIYIGRRRPSVWAWCADVCVRVSACMAALRFGVTRACAVQDDLPEWRGI